VIDPEVVPVVAPEFHERDPSDPVRPAIPPRPMTLLARPDDPITDEDDPEETTFNDTFLWILAPVESVAVILNW